MSKLQGPKVPPPRDSEPPKSANEFPDLERLDRPELDEDEWDDKSGVLRKTRPLAPKLDLARTA
jgi:hypothetical protein